MDDLEITKTPTRQQLATERLILSICINNQLGPEDLERLAHRLAAVHAIADACTDGVNHEHCFSSHRH